METTVTNQPGHKGAFAETMQGGAIYYTPDITAAKPQWREVFDLTTSNKQADPKLNAYGGGSNGGWLQTSPDDKYLYHAVVGRPKSGDDPGSPPYILVLDIQKLLASGDDPSCNIDTLDEVTAGGAESDCPAVASILNASRRSALGRAGQPELGEDGKYHETTQPTRLAYSNYFVARTGLNGDHRVCLADIGEGRSSASTSRSATSGRAPRASTSTGTAGRTATGDRPSRTPCCSSRPTTTSRTASSDASSHPSPRRGRPARGRRLRRGTGSRRRLCGVGGGGRCPHRPDGGELRPPRWQPGGLGRAPRRPGASGRADRRTPAPRRRPGHTHRHAARPGWNLVRVDTAGPAGRRAPAARTTTTPRARGRSPSAPIPTTSSPRPRAPAPTATGPGPAAGRRVDGLRRPRSGAPAAVPRRHRQRLRRSGADRAGGGRPRVRRRVGGPACSRATYSVSTAARPTRCPWPTRPTCVRWSRPSPTEGSPASRCSPTGPARGRAARSVVLRRPRPVACGSSTPTGPATARSSWSAGWSRRLRRAGARRAEQRRGVAYEHGVWLAPWLLTPRVVDAVSGTVLPLRFDVRGTAAQTYTAALRQEPAVRAPTEAGFAGGCTVTASRTTGRPACTPPPRRLHGGGAGARAARDHGRLVSRRHGDPGQRPVEGACRLTHPIDVRRSEPSRKPRSTHVCRRPHRQDRAHRTVGRRRPPPSRPPRSGSCWPVSPSPSCSGASSPPRRAPPRSPCS